MAVDPAKRQKVVDAAGEAFAEHGIAVASRRDIAKQAEVPLRTVTSVGRHRIDLLRQVVEQLPFPPVAQQMQQLAVDASEPALQALMRAAREVIGDPAAAWDQVELQALTAAPYDEATREVVVARLNRRWDAIEEVVRQLRDGSPPEDAIDDAAALHLMATGLGLAVLAPLSERWSDSRSWAALAARLLETLAASDAPPDPDQPDPHIWRARVSIGNAPSALAHLLRTLSVLRIHVVSLSTAPIGDERQLVDLILRAPVQIQGSTIGHGLSSVGADAMVVRGDIVDVGDVATRVLHLSALLAARPELAPRAAADLVMADSWEVTRAASGDDDSALVLRLQWTMEQHVVLRRNVAPFTRTEQMRASALLTLVSALSAVRGEEDSYGWRVSLRDEALVHIRLGRPDDTDAVERLHERCSADSRFQRYFTPMNEWREENLRRIAGGHRGATLVVTDQDDEIIALGNVFPAGPGDADAAEIAIIVDDAWHRRGIGVALTERLVEVARRMGFTELVAYVLAENRGMLSLLRSMDLNWTTGHDHDLGPSVTRLSATI